MIKLESKDSLGHILEVHSSGRLVTCQDALYTSNTVHPSRY